VRQHLIPEGERVGLEDTEDSCSRMLVDISEYIYQDKRIQERTDLVDIDISDDPD
jgi:hypothetical protein